MAQIPLVGGGFADVDDADVEAVQAYKWYCIDGYAKTTVHRKGSGRYDKDRNVNLTMHRLLLIAKPGEVVDHINRDRLDNRRSNLRIVTLKENSWNSSKHGNEGFTGVTKETDSVFHARLGGRSLGYFRTAVEAAQARDLACLKDRGEFAVLNFPKDSLPPSVTALPLRNTGARTSTVRGVSYASKRRAKQKWRVVLKKQHLGWFDTEQDAISFVKGLGP